MTGGTITTKDAKLFASAKLRAPKALMVKKVDGQES
jgi:hypothetical protein